MTSVKIFSFIIFFILIAAKISFAQETTICNLPLKLGSDFRVDKNTGQYNGDFLVYGKSGYGELPVVLKILGRSLVNRDDLPASMERIKKSLSETAGVRNIQNREFENGLLGFHSTWEDTEDPEGTAKVFLNTYFLQSDCTLQAMAIYTKESDKPRIKILEEVHRSISEIDPNLLWKPESRHANLGSSKISQWPFLVLIFLYLIIAGLLRLKKKNLLKEESEYKVLLRRFLARGLDGQAYMSIHFLLAPWLLLVFERALYFNYIYLCLFIVIEVVLTKFYGQTLGRKFFQIKVVSMKSKEITWTQAILRAVPFIVFAIVCSVYLYSYPEFFRKFMLNQPFRPDEVSPNLAMLVLGGFFIYSLVDLVVALLNKKRRSIRDFISGTAVTFKS